MKKWKLETKIGIVTFVNQKRGYGFIRQADGTQVFFHITGVCDMQFTDLREGIEVEYFVEDTPKGPKAIGVVAR